MTGIPHTLRVTIDCPIDGCHPTLNVRTSMGEIQRGPGNSATVAIEPAPGAVETAIREHFAAAHPDVEIPPGAFDGPQSGPGDDDA
jgi:hypothetical protein